ncbi:MAG TPA: transposase [Nodularia sp. (in: cyanobacteria)]|nr:transposase [Nodularia sp. (in: cyanobacteria)]
MPLCIKAIWLASSTNVGFSQGLYVFFLPPYSPQMNRIEDEWLHLLRDQLAGQLFEDEYELAIAIIALRKYVRTSF